MARPKKQANELTAEAVMAMRDEAAKAAVKPMIVDGREVYEATPAGQIAPYDAHVGGDDTWTPLKYAQQLAKHMASKHYAADAPEWRVGDELFLVLSQIDNMLTGLTRIGEQDVRIAELEAALRPFAEHGALLRKTDRLGAPRKQLYELGRSVLTLGHFDAARKLIFGDGNG